MERAYLQFDQVEAANKWIGQHRKNGTADLRIKIVFRELFFEDQSNGLEDLTPLANRLVPVWETKTDGRVQYNVLMEVSRQELYDAGLMLQESLWMGELRGSLQPGTSTWVDSHAQHGYLYCGSGQITPSTKTPVASKQPSFVRWLMSLLPSWQRR